MGWFGNKDLGYEVYRPYKGGKYKIVTNKNFGCATEWVPVFKTSRKQQAIELTAALNRRGPLEWDKHEDIVTKHYVFTWNGSRWNAKVIDYSSFVGEDAVEGLLEIIHRKNEKIAKLKHEYVSAKYDAEKYKTMLFDLYDKMTEKPENDKFWEIMNLLYQDKPEDVHGKLKAKKVYDTYRKIIRGLLHEN